MSYIVVSQISDLILEASLQAFITWKFIPILIRYMLMPFHAMVNTTLPETNIAPENGWLEYYFPIEEAYFQGLR